MTIPLKRRTVQVRISKSLKEIIDIKFPEVNKANFFDILYKTHPLMRVEAFLRKDSRNVKKK